MKLIKFCESMNCSNYRPCSDGKEYACKVITTHGFLNISSYVTPYIGLTPAADRIINEVKNNCIHYNVLKQTVAMENL